MNRPLDNVVPLVLPQKRRTCRRRELAKIIPLRPRRRPTRLSRAINLALGVLIIAAAVAGGALLLLSERDLIRDLGSWWPWYWPAG